MNYEMDLRVFQAIVVSLVLHCSLTYIEGLLMSKVHHKYSATIGKLINKYRLTVCNFFLASFYRQVTVAVSPSGIMTINILKYAPTSGNNHSPSLDVTYTTCKIVDIRDRTILLLISTHNLPTVNHSIIINR